MVFAIGFSGPVKLGLHFQEHGVDFNAVNEQDYLQRALAFLLQPLGDPMLHECIRRSSQDIIRFDETTDEFAVVQQNGIIRTYYKPIPAYRAPPGTLPKKMHPYPTNLDYYLEACKK